MLLQHHGRSLIVDAPAKLNLFLEVLGKRADGFHELETLMVSVGLYDRLCFTEEASEEIRLRCYDAGSINGTDTVFTGEIPVGRDNLVVQAANLLREYSGVKQGVSIGLLKRIPAAAGLAGGSSDAAATLVALNRFWNLGLNLDELNKLASQLGSDVGFFLSPTAAAVCTGRGEKIEPVQLPLCLHFVIARPLSGLSTAVVYQHCHAATSPKQSSVIVDCFQKGDIGRAGSLLHNSLQKPAEKLNTEVTQLRSIFSRQPVLGHLMSGSGTAYFGMCANKQHAKSVAARLRMVGKAHVFVAQSRA